MFVCVCVCMCVLQNQILYGYLLRVWSDLFCEPIYGKQVQVGGSHYLRGPIDK